MTILIPKKKKDMTNIYNMRPITMFPLITNLIVRIISTRLVVLIQDHGLLHVNNRGFIKGGNTAQCIDAVLDLVEECRGSEHLHMVKLDIRKAYDSVQFFHVQMAFERLCAPPRVVHMFMNLVKGGTRRIRTAYGYTSDVLAMRSLGQGMSASAPIFAVVIDSLHAQMAHRFSTVLFKSPSIGFADDITLLCRLFSVLVDMLAYSVTWCLAHHLQLAGDKIEHYMKGDISSITPLVVDHTKIIPRGGDQEIDYLGIQFTLNGDLSCLVRSLDNLKYGGARNYIVTMSCENLINISNDRGCESGVEHPSLVFDSAWDSCFGIILLVF